MGCYKLSVVRCSKIDLYLINITGKGGTQGGL
jgi:hypothetical protein